MMTASYREELILSNMPQVQLPAWRLHHRCPQVTCSCSQRDLICFGDSACTGVRHASSNHRIACLSMARTLVQGFHHRRHRVVSIFSAHVSLPPRLLFMLPGTMFRGLWKALFLCPFLCPHSLKIGSNPS